jgi:hypothetical protein
MPKMNMLQRAIEHCSNFEDGSEHFKIRDRCFDGFNDAMAEFYLDLPSYEGYGHLKYSQITFHDAQNMARFVGLLRVMLPAASDPHDEPLVDLNLQRNTASVLESRWPSDEMKKALRANGISGTVRVYHHFAVEFHDDQELRHFLADCDFYDVKFGEAGFDIPKFQLLPPKAVGPATAEGMSYNDSDDGWDVVRHHNGHDYQLSSFSNREHAAIASAQFDYLVSLIPAALERRNSKRLSSTDNGPIATN